jgi:2-iminobutanoate/2-iminopropanoate deaminase
LTLIRHSVDQAPPPPAGVHYHHATRAGPFLYVTGQLPTDPDAPSAAFADGIVDQAERVFRNLEIIISSAGFAWRDTVFVRIYLADFDRDFGGFNSVYHRVFTEKTFSPSRTTVGVARLGRGALVEVDLVLYKEA